MTIQDYDLWRFVHVLLFVYWLGADLGVFYSARFVARRDLPLDERMRFLELTLLVDMGPRTGLILILPVGFQLSVMSGLIDLSQWQLVLIWALSLLWLGVMWAVHLQRHANTGAGLQKIDMVFRYAVIAGMAALGVLSLTTSELFQTTWLSLKSLLFAAVVATGVYLRTIIAAWGVGFDKLASEDSEQHAIGNDLIARAGRQGEFGAFALWAMLLALAFLGVVKPF